MCQKNLNVSLLIKKNYTSIYIVFGKILFYFIFIPFIMKLKTLFSLLNHTLLFLHSLNNVFKSDQDIEGLDHEQHFFIAT